MSKTTKTIIWIVVIVIVIATIWIGVNHKPAANNQIKIGVILPLTGPAADYGQWAKKGVDLAMSEVKKNYGLNFSMLYEDSQADPKLAVNSIQKLINVDGVKYVVGFTSGETLAMCPIADSNKVILMSSATNPDIATKCGDYTFSDDPSDIYQGQVLASKISSKGYTNVAVFYINNQYGTGLKNEFVKNFKGTITDIEAHELGATSFQTQLTKIKASKPEAIVLISQLPEAVLILQERVQLGINQPIFGSEAMKTDDLLKAGSKALSNLYVTFISQYNGSEFKSYGGEYQQKYGQTYGAYSDYIHDIVIVFADAIKKCGEFTNVNCVKNQIYQTKVIGATGPINFDSSGSRINKDYTLFKVENGNFVPAK